MRPWRRGRRSGTRPSSAFSTRRTGSGRSRGGFHSACEIREHLSRNALPIALSSARERCAKRDGILVLSGCRDFGFSNVTACAIVRTPSAGSVVLGCLVPLRMTRRHKIAVIEVTRKGN